MTAGLAAELDRYVWTRRVLLVFAQDACSPDLATQRAAWDAETRGMTERDLVLLTSIGGGAEQDALRRRFEVAGAPFAALLIGKDGGVKLRSASPIGAPLLFRTIDAMPMRRNEAARR